MKRKMACVMLCLWVLSCAFPVWTGARSINTVDGSDWGLTLSAENVTPAGMTLVTTHSGGNISGDLECGCEFWVEVFSDDSWKRVPYIRSVSWTMEAYSVEQNSSFKEDINWENMYGKLSPGNYRFCKEFMDFRGDDGYDEAVFYAEFTVTAETNADTVDVSLMPMVAILLLTVVASSLLLRRKSI